MLGLLFFCQVWHDNYDDFTFAPSYIPAHPTNYAGISVIQLVINYCGRISVIQLVINYCGRISVIQLVINYCGRISVIQLVINYCGRISVVQLVVIDYNQ